MKKQLLLGMSILGMGLCAYAESLTPEQALSRLSSADGPRKVRTMNGSPRLVHTAFTDKGNSAVYVFNQPDESGYLLLSADDVALPLLGYADEGTFDPDNVAPAMQWWLNEYAAQIEYAISNGININSTSETPRRKAALANNTEIAPMLKTDWDQGSPYNNQCPTDATVRTYTGCVATAMAQVMNYWKYPERGTGTITYTAETLDKKLTMNLSKTAFDWDNMLDIYLPGKYNETQANAVAYLMKACGYAVKMDYGTDSSGALAMNICKGLTKYFNYDGNASYELRMMYSSDEWAQMIYDNLKNVGPILYGGGSYIGGGHSFVCDGYKDGLFHFNWGWTGMSNGYYSLEALNPSSLGAGGGGGGGYNFTQDAVLGIQPPTGNPVVTKPDQLIEMGSLVGEVANDSLFIYLEMQSGGMWVNYNPNKMHVNVALKFEPQGSTPGETKYFNMSSKAIEIDPGYGTGPEYVNSARNLSYYGLSDGTYKVSVSTLDTDDASAEWLPVRNPYTYYDYFVLKKSGKNYTVDNMIPASIDVIDGGFTGDIYYGCVERVWAEVENKWDIEVSTGLAPFLTGDYAFLGESVLVSVPPHSTKRVEWTTTLYALQQMYEPTADIPLYMTFMDENSMLLYSNDIAKKVTLKPNPGSPSVSISNLKVTGKSSLENVDGTYKTVYTISDPTDINISANLTLTKGYFAYPVVACICDDDLNIETYGGETLFLDQNIRTRFSTTISYPALQPDELYNIILAYDISNGFVPFTTLSNVCLRLDSAGVEEVVADSETLSVNYDKATGVVTGKSNAGAVSITVYNVSGATVAAGTDTISLSEVATGVVIIKAIDAAGNSKTIKVVK